MSRHGLVLVDVPEVVGYLLSSNEYCWASSFFWASFKARSRSSFKRPASLCPVDRLGRRAPASLALASPTRAALTGALSTRINSLNPGRVVPVPRCGSHPGDARRLGITGAHSGFSAYFTGLWFCRTNFLSETPTDGEALPLLLPAQGPGSMLQLQSVGLVLEAKAPEVGVPSPEGLPCTSSRTHPLGQIHRPARGNQLPCLQDKRPCRHRTSHLSLSLPLRLSLVHLRLEQRVRGPICGGI